MNYCPGPLPLSESENEMADKGIIIEDRLPVGVTFHIQDEVKTKAVTTNKINNCHIWNKVTVQSLFPVANEMSQSPGF